MNREEIEKLIEETARKERSKRKGVSVQKVRSILNVVFMLCAVAGLILYFAWPDNRLAHLLQHRAAALGLGLGLPLLNTILRAVLETRGLTDGKAFQYMAYYRTALGALPNLLAPRVGGVYAACDFGRVPRLCGGGRPAHGACDAPSGKYPPV